MIIKLKKIYKKTNNSLNKYYIYNYSQQKNFSIIYPLYVIYDLILEKFKKIQALLNLNSKG